MSSSHTGLLSTRPLFPINFAKDLDAFSFISSTIIRRYDFSIGRSASLLLIASSCSSSDKHHLVPHQISPFQTLSLLQHCLSALRYLHFVFRSLHILQCFLQPCRYPLRCHFLRLHNAHVWMLELPCVLNERLLNVSKIFAGWSRGWNFKASKRDEYCTKKNSPK